MDDSNATDRYGKHAALTAYDAMQNNPEAKRPRKKGDVPTQDDINSVDRYDQRSNATTVTGLGQSSSGIGAMNQPSEHS